MTRTLGRCALAAWLLAAPAVFAASTAEVVQPLIDKGQFEQALQKLDREVSASPQDAESRFLRGLVLVKLERPDDAIRAFSDLTRDFPQLPEPYNNLAVLYAQRGDYEKARDALEAALATHPSYATAHENLGDIYSALAGAAYNRALMLDQSNEAVRTKLSLLSQLSPGGVIPPAAVRSAATRPASVTTAPEAAVATEPAPAGAAVNEDAQALKAVQAWANAWSARDLSRYFAAYAPDFVPEDGLDIDAWRAQRRERIAGSSRIYVAAANPQLTRLGEDRVRVSFTQKYASDRHADQVSKALDLKRVGDSWKIVREYTP